MSCDHPVVMHHLDVIRVVDLSRRLCGFKVTLRVRCSSCAEVFRFPGLRAGDSASEPTVSADAEELRAPFWPSSVVESAVDGAQISRMRS